MATREYDIKEVVSEIARRERRAFWRSWVYSGIALLAAVLWLSYTVYKTNQLGNEAAKLTAQIGENQIVLDQQRKEIGENKELLDKLKTLTIKGFGGDASAQAPVGNEQIQQSLAADSARQEIVSDTTNERRHGVQVQYFLKNADQHQKLESALRELGFQLDIKNPINDLPTNAIWFGRLVNADDAKLTAFTLIRAGVEIKEIRRFKLGSPRADSSLIQVGSDPSLLNTRPLTVEEIDRKTQFDAN